MSYFIPYFRPGAGKLQLWAKAEPLSASVNKVLLEHSLTLALTCCLSLLSCYNNGLEKLWQRLGGPAKSKLCYWLTGLTVGRTYLRNFKNHLRVPCPPDSD